MAGSATAASKPIEVSSVSTRRNDATATSAANDTAAAAKVAGRVNAEAATTARAINVVAIA